MFDLCRLTSSRLTSVETFEDARSSWPRRPQNHQTEQNKQQAALGKVPHSPPYNAPSQGRTDHLGAPRSQKSVLN